MSLFWNVACVVSAAAAVEPPVPEVMKELHRIEVASLKGASDSLRPDYLAQSRERPGDPMSRVYLAWLTLPSDDAWNQLKAIATIYPDNPWVHYGMGRIYLKWKMRDQAKAEAEQALKRDPRFYPAMMVLGELALTQEAPAKAEAEFRRALGVADEPWARTGLGLALLAQGKKAEGLDALKASVHQAPEQPVALAALIPLLMESKDPAAIEAAQAAAELRPKDKEARRALAELELAAGDTEGAAREYNRLVGLGNADQATLERLAGLYRQLDAGVDEERVLTALAAVDPAGTQPLVRLQELRRSRQDLPGAEAALGKLLERDPENLKVRVALARLKEEMGQLYQALEQYRLAAAATTADGDVKGAVTRLEGELRLPKPPLKGNVNWVYGSIAFSLKKLFAERRLAHPELGGKVKVRAQIGPAGRITTLEILEDSLADPVLLGHIYFSLKDAQYQEKKVEPVIEFELGAKK